MVVTAVESMSLNNIVLIVTASVSNYFIVHIFMVLVPEFDRYLKLSACGPVSIGLVCLHADGVS